MKTGSIYLDGTYLERNPSWHQQDSPWKAAHIARMLSDHAIEPRTIGEVGCGAGEVLAHLADAFAGRDVTLSGYDLSPQALEICRRKERPNLGFHLGDPLQSSDASFDVVLAIDVFEHVEDYFGFLRKLRAKGTWKLFHIPLDLSVQSVLRAGPILRLRRSVGHIQYFTKETALATLADTGYEVIDWRYTCGSLDLARRGWRATLMKLPRRALHAIDEDWAARLLGGFSLLVLAR